MSQRTRVGIRWFLRGAGGVLIALWAVALFYAHTLGGAEVGDGTVIEAGDTEPRYLVSGRSAVQCTLDSVEGPSRVVEVPRAARGLRDGVRVEPPDAEVLLTCDSPSTVRVTSGPMLSLYPLFEGRSLGPLAGVVLIGLSFIITPPRPKRSKNS